MNNNTSPLSQIGIVGGAGPMAGVQLFQKIISTCQTEYACQNDADFPLITLLSYPFADMLSKQRDKLRVKQQLMACLAKLANDGADFAVIACNTLHQFLPQPKELPLALVNIIAETGQQVEQSKATKCLVLCTESSAASQVHKSYFDCEYLDDALQQKIDLLIAKILAGQQQCSDAQALVRLLNSLQTQDARFQKNNLAVVLGCTELSVLEEQFPLRLNGLNNEITLLDPNQIAAEKICQNIFNK